MSVYDYTKVEDIERAIGDLSFMLVVGVFEEWQTQKVFERIDELERMKIERRERVMVGFEACMASEFNKDSTSDQDPEWAEMVSEEHKREEEAKAVLLAHVAAIEKQRSAASLNLRAMIAENRKLLAAIAELQQQLAVVTKERDVGLSREARRLRMIQYLEQQLAAAREALDTIRGYRDVPVGVLRCMDCQMPYGHFPLDTHLPTEQWLEIHDNEGGVLCANCIVARAKARVPGISVVFLNFREDDLVASWKRIRELEMQLSETNARLEVSREAVKAALDNSREGRGAE